ncbi:MAG: hypothetical protein JWM49_2800 [Microbacteriaceae bacterium]|nr:hypothetical protein [Microbacteriaceae bacterium]
MTDRTPEPSGSAGVDTVRLDADRTRDELERTLNQIESRLAPKELWKSVTLAFRERPVRAAAVSGGIALAIGGLITRAVRHRNG